ncbi:MAG: ABC transporter permease [Rubrobacter sp.]|jgi:osmoprotectant transport system permease protein|nr:ABC transporter permease [Rubrobacter sp.]
MGDVFQVFLRDDFLILLRQHVVLSVAAVVIAVAVAVPVALAVRNTRVGAVIAINIGNLGRAIPSLALLAIALPFLGFGFRPALVALTLTAIPPILINASTALRQVDRQVLDAARGMGLSEGQILSRVQLPIAAPVIFAGIRTSAVQVVANATLATFIGGGALGELIVLGFQSANLSIQIGGALAVAALAITTEVLFGFIERTFTPKGLQIAQKRRGK